jgi:hypothetical protein
MISFRINSSGNIAAYTNSTTLLATGTTVLSTGTWYLIEIKNGRDAGGVVEWKVNGTVDVSTTATLPGVNSGLVVYGKLTNRNGNTVDYYFDDCIYSDAAYPGAGRVTCLLPNANGTYQTWTIGAGSGSHYQIVNERPPDGDTSYLQSPLITNDFETEALTDGGTAGITGTVNSVMSCAILKQDPTLTGGTARVALRSNTTDDTTSSDYTTTSSYVLIGKIYDTDPATSAAWVLSALDSIETGAEDTSAVNPVRMTWTGAMVDYTPSAGIAGEEEGLYYHSVTRW